MLHQDNINNVNNINNANRTKIRQDIASAIGESHQLPQYFINDFLENPSDYFTTSKETSMGRSLFNIHVFLPNLNECSCGNFNRLENNRRNEIENKIIAFVKKNYPIKGLSLNLLSFGSGGFFQDFVLICKLVQSGYRYISFTFVDIIFKEIFNQLQIKIDSTGKISSEYPSADDFFNQPFATFDSILDKLKLGLTGGYEEVMKKASSLSTFIQFLAQIATQNGVTFNLDFKSNISLVSTYGKNTLHVITAIDYTSGFEDINEMANLHRLIQTDHAQLFLSIKNFNFIFNRDGCISREDYNNSVSNWISPYNPIIKDISNINLVNQGQAIQYTQLSDNFTSRIIEWLYILPQLANRDDCQRIHLNYVENSDTENKIAPENLAHFLQLFLPKGKTISVNKLSGLEDWMKQSYKSVTGIVSLLNVSMEDPDENENKYKKYLSYGPEYDKDPTKKQYKNEKMTQNVLTKLKNDRSGLIIYCNVNISKESKEYTNIGCCLGSKTIFNETWKWQNGNIQPFTEMNQEKVSISINKLIFEKEVPVNTAKGTLFNDYQINHSPSPDALDIKKHSNLI